MRNAPVARSISTRTAVPHERRVAGTDPVEVGRRKLDAGAIETNEIAAAAAHGQSINVGCPRLAIDAEGRVRPCPAIEAVRHRCGHAILCVRLGRHRRQGQRRKSGHDELPILPARLLPFPGSGITRRDAPQFERRRPQAEAENDSRGLGRRVCPGKCAPVEAAVAELIAGTQRGSRASASCVSWSIA